MRIYHGSEIIIEKPTFGAGKKYNDYGLGFYTTENYDLACEWAARPNNDGYVNCYDLDISALSVLDLNSKEFSILNWLAVLLRYRNFDKTSPLAQEGYEYLQKNFYIDVNNYDVIKGYRADDSYFAYASDFISGTLTLPQLKRAMYLGELGEQIVLKTKKAFANLKFIESKAVAPNSKYYISKENRDQRARETFFKSRKNFKRVKGELTIISILDEEIKANDPRLYQI